MKTVYHWIALVLVGPLAACAPFEGLSSVPTNSPRPGPGSCHGATPPKPPASGVLVVKVEDAQGQPVASARVEVAKTAARYTVLCSPVARPPTYASGTTDADGRFRIPRLEVGTYAVEAELGTAQGQASAEVSAHAEDHTITVRLQDAPASDTE